MGLGASSWNPQWRSARCPCDSLPFLASTEEGKKAVDELSWTLYSACVFYQHPHLDPLGNEMMHLEGFNPHKEFLSSD